MTARPPVTARRRTHVSTVLVASALLVGSSAACAVRDTLPPPDCDSGGSIVIVAQSVPTASMVPCLDPLPPGWAVATVLVNESHSVVTLDSDRAGPAAAVLRYEASCELGDAGSVPSRDPAVSRYDVTLRTEPSFRAERFYRFEGGCVTWTFDFDGDAPLTESLSIERALRLYPRTLLNEDLRDFVGENA